MSRKEDKKRGKKGGKSRREVLAASAGLSAAIGAAGLAGTGLGTAMADEKTKADGSVRQAPSPMHKVRPKSAPMHKVRPKSRNEGLLPAIQRRQFDSMLKEAMRSGDPRAALKKYPDLKLSPAQRRAVLSLTRDDLRALQRLQVKLRPLQGLHGAQRCLL